MEATAGKSADGVYGFKCTGTVDGQTAVQARIDLRAFNLADTNSSLAAADADILAELTQQFGLIGGSALLPAG